MTCEQMLDVLYGWLGPRAVLLPIPLGTKIPDWKGWQQTTFEQTQTPEYRARLIEALRRGGNLGVLLGEGLISIDVDDDAGVDEFLALNSELTGTLQSKGCRGRNIWLHMDGEYPHQVYKLKTADRKPWGEWRGGGGCQTVIFGQHPNGTPDNIIRYVCVSKKPTMQGQFQDIVWPAGLVLPWLKKATHSEVTATPPTQVSSELHERILAYVARADPAIEGNGGDQQTFKVACSLVNGWALTAEQALPYLEGYNAKCEPPWTEKELRHKLAKAETAPHEKPRGHLIGCILKIKKKDEAAAHGTGLKRPRDPGDDWEEPPIFYKPYDFSAPVTPEFDDDALPFPLEVFPTTLKAPVEEMIRHYKVKAALPATIALCVNSAAVGRGVIVMSNVRRTYANIYALLGAESGTGKSVVHEDLSQVMLDVQNEILEKFLKEEKPSLEAELRLLEREIQDIIKEKVPELAGDTRQLRLTDLFKKQAELDDKLESAYRLVSSDFTSEALGKLLASSGEQMAVLSDEGGIALYNMMGRYTKGDTTDDIFLSMCKTVTSHIVDRATRPPILLKSPCVTLLLMVQPDLLNKAFADERLRVGGFLARCFFFDSRMEVQYEDEHSLPVPAAAVVAAWNKHIRGLLEAFRFAEQSFVVEVSPEVRVASRKFKNEIVDRMRGDLVDVKTFAIRWCERAWEIALNFHVATHSIDCFKQPLILETFNNAVKVVRWFIEEELRVLQISRCEVINKTRERLEEIFRKNGNTPVTLRNFDRHHRIEKSDVIACVKSNEFLFTLAVAHSPHGGRASTVVFLRSHPPPGWNKTK
jgi:hypothetical protein